MAIIDIFHFAQLQCYPGTSERIWGTIEKLENGPMCALYRNESDSVRAGARVTHNGFLPFSEQLEMHIEEPICVGKVFRWNGRYNLTDNNCIHYALGCWGSLEEPLHGMKLWMVMIHMFQEFTMLVEGIAI